VADGSGPVVVHPWLGRLRWHEPGELLGSLDVDPDVRPPRMNGGRDVEVVLHVMPGVTDAVLQEHVDQCAAGIRDALGRLASIRQFAAEHAPAGWAAQYAPESGSAAGLLFLDYVEAGGNGQLALVFDFGDLDQLVVRLDGQGKVAQVSLRA
jgi:hypothetical protein